MMQSVEFHADGFKSKVINELNGTAEPKDRATVNFSNPGFLAFALRDAFEARLRQVADEWLAKQHAPTPAELEQARSALERSISHLKQIEAL